MTKSNVLLICVDQMAGSLMRPAGHEVIMTPTLAQLARNGTYFPNTYSSCPICIPARRSLMLGQTHRAHGDRIFNEHMEMPVDVPTLASTFKDNGYQCYAVGKLHVYPQRDRIGFDEVILNEEGRHHIPHAKGDDWEMTLAENGYAGMEYGGGMNNNDYMLRPWHLPEKLHPTNWTAYETCKMIRRRNPLKPAFWYTSFVAPHPPVNPPQAYLDLYRDIDIDEPVVGDWAKEFGAWPHLMKTISDKWALYGAPKHEIEMVRRAWYATITHIDHQLRTILGTLREEGIMNDTHVAFVSDHGEMLGDHQYWAKTCLYENAARIPFILDPAENSPYSKPGSVDERLVDLCDIMPTLLQMNGIPVPEHVDGLSAVGEKSREYLYGESLEGDKATRMIRDDRYKLIYYAANNHFQLFDLAEDRQELHDLSNNLEHKDTFLKLKSELEKCLYGNDAEFMRDGELVGLPGIEFKHGANHRYSGQRGYRFI